jgi:hypothetical protein
MTEAAFYTVTGRDFFPGAVALINSLRVLGHAEPVFVLDCGMEPGQRDRLERHATVLDAPSDAPPSLLKLVAPQSRPANTMVLLDADVIVTRPLTELIETVSGGRLLAFENDHQRFFAEWGELLDLDVEPGRPYVSTCAVFVDAALASTLLPIAHRRQLEVDRGRTWLEDGPESDPLYFLDQDVLNAILAARLRPEQVEALEGRLAANPPFGGLRLADPGTLRCAYRDGAAPYLLHHWARKPWLAPVRSNPYSRLLSRLLLGPDVALRLDDGELPLRLRTGPAAGAARFGVDAALTVPGARRRLTRRSPRIKAWPNARSAGAERR